MLITANENGTGTGESGGYTLSANDRCDSCGAQAYIRVEIASGGELFFCAHHGKKFQEKLSGVAKSWHDESAKLLES